MSRQKLHKKNIEHFFLIFGYRRLDDFGCETIVVDTADRPRMVRSSCCPSLSPSLSLLIDCIDKFVVVGRDDCCCCCCLWLPVIVFDDANL
ncbi:hypothetical protein DERP_008733 [Dermatophagoides pteronyssinus]|uniref:Uncharacterized protein n=1 Tax=Dermatophagoides pteronyssinus TaxID=6956 RepID=A0ABQ8IW71_DERPT|nr:hypothetical protein DERP_008733 [Dermatophagoides pteronyssinus]